VWAACVPADAPPSGATSGSKLLNAGAPSPRHLEQVLTVYVRHYNTARPHRGINLRVPAVDRELAPANLGEIRRIDRVDVLRGLIHEYRPAA
jgi:Integrase core domain